MKKIAIAVSFMFFTVRVFAFNPPMGGEELSRLTHPELMRGAASVTGGPDDTVVPASITYNPALTADIQRIDLDLSGSLLFNLYKVNMEGAGSDNRIGGGFQLGMIIPTKWTVLAFSGSGLFSDFNGMNLRNTLSLHVGASKEFTESLSLGINVYGGFYLGSGADFSVGADLGALYKLGDLGFLKDSRAGLSFLNLGKPVDYKTIGMNGSYSSSTYPSIFTPRVGFASTIFQVKQWKGSFSVDAAFPSFQDCVFDLGFGVDYNDFLRLSVAWQANIREMVEGGGDGTNLVAIGVSFKFGVTSRKISEKNADWEKSEVTPAVATQYLYSGIQAVSFGARIDLGLKDTEAPEIILWDEE